MKKLMMFVGVTMLACVTQAAAVKWSTGALKAPNESGVPTTALGTSTAYACELFFFSDSTLVTAVTTTGTTASKTALSAFSNLTGDNFAAGTTYYVYAKVTSNDGKWSMTSATGTFTAPTTGNAGINFTTGQSMGGTSLWPTTWTSTAVPEPATVGLLLLGLCAVGLKRRV